MIASLWRIRQFRSVVHEFRDSECDPDLWSEILIKYALLKEKGNLCTSPVTKPLGNGIFELRAKWDTKQPRLLFYFSKLERRLIVIVHALMKKTRNVPPADIELAKQRRGLIESKSERHYGLDFDDPAVSAKTPSVH